MSLPMSRNETAVPGISQVPSATINDLQDWEARLYSGQCRGDIAINEEFTGDSLDRSKWQNVAAGLTFPNSGALGGSCGIAKLDPVPSGTCTLLTAALVLGTWDFHFTFIVKMPNFATAAAADVVLGLFSATQNDCAYFNFSRSAGAMVNIRVVHDTTAGTNDAAGHGTADAGIAVPSANFMTLEIKRTGTKLEFFCDGNVVYTATNYVRSLASNQLGISTTVNQTSGVVYADTIKGRGGRGFSTTGNAGAGATGHIEQGVAVFAESGIGAGYDYVDVVFNSNFADTNYNHNPVIERTDSVDESPGGMPWITNKAVGGMRINVPAQFGGKLRWQAWT